MSTVAAPPDSPKRATSSVSAGAVSATAAPAAAASEVDVAAAATQRLSINQPAPSAGAAAGAPGAPTKPAGVVHRSKGNRRRLSLLGPTGVERPRRASVLAASVQDMVMAAPAEGRLGVLMGAMVQEQGKLQPLLAQELVYEEPDDTDAPIAPGQPDPEMASWAMSAMNELCAGNGENRAAVAAGGGTSMILDFMSFYHNDLYCQWQGCYSLAALAADEAHARAFGTAGIDAVLSCIGRTDLSELAAASSRALNALCRFDQDEPLAELIAHAKAHGVEDEIGKMLATFSSDMQFQYRGSMLLKKFKDFEC